MNQTIKALSVLFIIIISGQVFAQNTSGEIIFERKQFWVNIYTKLPFLTKEQIEREMAVWGKDQGNWAEKYLLKFGDNKSIYTQMEEEQNYGYSWRQEEVMFYRDYKEKTLTDKLPLGAKDYLLTGDIPRIKWKIQNELRDIQGYICMKAIAEHPIYGTPVTAWYTDLIPLGGGPEGFGGLPGMILMLTFNEDDVVIEATSVKLNVEGSKVELPKKLKGKEIALDKYVEDKKKFMKEALDNRRNPYNNLRY